MTPRDETDVLVVGAGLSGAIASLRLARAGVRVTCLEQGDWQNPEDFPGNKPTFEVAAMGPWHANPNIRRNSADYPIADDSSDISPMLFNGVGGSTILYSAHWMRFLPSDFHVRSLDGMGTDWPFDYRELSPYYDRVERDIGVSGIAGDPAYPDRTEYPMPPLPIGDWGRKVAAAHHRLGWHWWPGSNAITSRPYNGRRPCVQRSTCRGGCNEGAKGTVDRTHWPEALSLGVDLRTGARVSRIMIDRSGLAKSVTYHDPEGVEWEVRGKIVILTAHAIGTARLLLMSACPGWHDGLANRSGQVGRNLMMHPLARVVGFFDENLESWQGHWGQSLYCLEFAKTDRRRGFIRGAKWNLVPSGGPLLAALYPTDGAPGWGAGIHERVSRWLGRSAIWGITAEDIPHPDNRVTLDETLSDAQGNPAPRLHYRVDDNSRNMLAYMVERARESFLEAGATDTETQTLARDTGWHALGTCRMGDDPATSVLDRWNRSHDIPNLYVMDGSSFVTGSSVNPAATIAALALRATEQLIDQRRNQRVPV